MRSNSAHTHHRPYLLPAWLLDNEHFTPDLDASGFWVGAATPGKTRQGLIIFSQPVGAAPVFLWNKRTQEAA